MACHTYAAVPCLWSNTHICGDEVVRIIALGWIDQFISLRVALLYHALTAQAAVCVGL